MTNSNSRINTGDWVGSQLKGPHWSPYAQAITEHYPVQIPWFYTLPTTLTGVVPQQRTVITRPQQHDVLILGANAIVRGPFPDDGNYIFLQVTHLETGVPWVVPNVTPYIPLPAIAGLINVAFGLNLTHTLKLPEAFFLPKHNRLKLDWAAQTDGANTDALITFIGVQLIGRESPKEVIMPDGTITKVGSRLPWFATLGLGEFILIGGDHLELQYTSNTQFAQFTPPQDCGIELHDVYFNSKHEDIVTVNTQNLRLKLTVTEEENSWTPEYFPIGAFAGDERQVNPALPFTKPLLLKAGRRVMLVDQNIRPLPGAFLQGLITLRGVRLCQY